MKKNLVTVSVAFLMMLIPLFLGGCAKSESAAIGTSEIVTTYVVQAENGRVICQAIFQVGGSLGTYLELSEGEKVYCGDGERTVELKKTESLFNVVSYAANTDLRYEVGRDYTLTFVRKDGQTLVSSIQLPEEVVITAPIAGRTSHKGELLPVRWIQGNGSSMDVQLLWETANGQNSTKLRSVEDNGRFNFIDEETRVKDNSGQLMAGQVSASVKVTRVVRKGVSPKFRTGTIAGKQSQTVRFTLID